MPKSRRSTSSATRTRRSSSPRNVADRSGPVLDIGTATGALLVALRDLGFTSLHGVEPSPDAARKAQGAHGLDVVVGDMRRPRALGAEFGLVSYVAVLEHLVDPRRHAARGRRPSRPDGSFSSASLTRVRFSDHVDAPFQEFSVEHINYFTTRRSRTLLGAVGLEVVAERSIVVIRVGTDADGPAHRGPLSPTASSARIRIDRLESTTSARYIARVPRRRPASCEQIARLARSAEPDLRLGHRDERPAPAWDVAARRVQHRGVSRLEPALRRAGARGPPGDGARDAREPSTPRSWCLRRQPDGDRSGRARAVRADVPLILMY